MPDQLLLATSTQLLTPDASANFSTSYETGIVLRLRGKMHGPGSGAGERIFRRLYITVLHGSGAGFYVTPYVDGREQSHLRTYCSRPAAPDGEERFTFMIPLWKTNPDFPNVTGGLRGVVLEVAIEATQPSALWHLESASVGFQRVNEARGRTTDE